MAFIARDNLMVSDTAIELCLAYTHKTVGITSDRESLKKGLDTILDVYRYYRDKELKSIQNKLILTFLEKEQPYQSFKQYVSRKDSSLLRKIKVCQICNETTV